MAFTDGNMSPADIAAVTRGNDGFDGFGGNGIWWILILFLFAFSGNGFGNGWGNNGAIPYMMNNNTNNDVQRGFDQQAVMNGIGANNAAICNLGTAMNAGFAAAEASNNARQIADMQQMFALQMAQQNCCCENRSAVADLKYTVATENCQDRFEAANNTRDLMAQNTANSQSIIDNMTRGPSVKQFGFVTH